MPTRQAVGAPYAAGLESTVETEHEYREVSTVQYKRCRSDPIEGRQGGPPGCGAGSSLRSASEMALSTSGPADEMQQYLFTENFQFGDLRLAKRMTSASCLSSKADPAILSLSAHRFSMDCGQSNLQRMMCHRKRSWRRIEKDGPTGAR